MNNKIKILVLMGGNSNEHEVSIMSARNIYINLDEKYDKRIIYLDKNNDAYEIDEKDFLNKENFNIKYLPKKISKLNLIKEMKKEDIVFPVLHGNYGEDGTIQKIFEENNIKYIGSSSYSSKISFDKTLTKKYIEESNKNIKQAKYEIVFKKENEKYFLKDMNFPVYIKPARSGSSVGVYKVHNNNELEEKLEEAFKIDEKVIIEEEIVGLEIEVAILQDGDKLIVSDLGIIFPDSEFYTYDSKYNSKESSTIIAKTYEDVLNSFKAKKINLDIDDEKYIKKEIEIIKEKAKEIFKILKCKDLARIDFFLEKDGYVFNEINTLPGFTNISMYPKLMMEKDLNVSNILDIFVKNNI